MTVRPAEVPSESARNRGRLYAAAESRLRGARVPPNQVRRRIMITLGKWLLPLCAVTLLTMIVVWPELDRATEKARLAIRRVAANVEGGQLVDARYNGLDEKGRPYTVTAAVARQVNPERIDLTAPNADMTLQNGTWLSLKSMLGTYMQKLNQLDLWQDVVLYRDDGTTLTTSSASIDVKAGAAAGSEPVHVEGPWGTLDAQGFTVIEQGAAIQFIGPAHAVLNGAEP